MRLCSDGQKKCVNEQCFEGEHGNVEAAEPIM